MWCVASLSNKQTYTQVGEMVGGGRGGGGEEGEGGRDLWRGGEVCELGGGGGGGEGSDTSCITSGLCMVTMQQASSAKPTKRCGHFGLYCTRHITR